MNTIFFKALIWICNRRLINYLLRIFANGKLSRRFIPFYVRKFKISLDEVRKPLNEFVSLNDFFIRELQTEARPIHPDEDIIVSPVDCKLELSSSITADAEFTIKGQTMSLEELLGSKNLAEDFEKGHIFVLYLSPADYHRIHAPLSNECMERYTLGKTSWPVNEAGLLHGPRPLCTNYRVIHLLENGAAAIFVGATNVNSIICHDLSYWQKGAELGYFQFGSTVILLFRENQVDALALQDQRLRMGEALARFRT